MSPQLAHCQAKGSHTVGVGWHRVIREEAAHHATKPLPLLWNGLMLAQLKLSLDVRELRLHPFAHRAPHEQEPPRSRLAADVRKAEKIEGPRTLPLDLAAALGRSTKTHQPSLLRVQFQGELAHSFAQVLEKLLGFPFVLESEQHVVRLSHDDNVAAGFEGAPLLDPQVEDVVQIHVREQRRY